MNLFPPKLLLILFISLFASVTDAIRAQSTLQSAPTAVTTNRIDGIIPARPVGDSRLTNHFYTFEGDQGDVFINIVTENLDGDIDVFTIDSLRPLTKITVFSDNSNAETGRIVYLRKPEKLLLRVQGRTPGDEPAKYQIKFAGSFKALPPSPVSEAPKVSVERESRPGDVIVNSVGTIIGVVPKPTPEPEIEKNVETPLAKTKEKNINLISSDNPGKGETSARIEIRIEPEIAASQPVPEVKTEESKPVVVVTEDIPLEIPKIESKKADAPPAAPSEERSQASPADKAPEPAVSVSPMSPEQLSKIELVVQFKDGKTLRQPMNTVFSFNVNQGILTIVSNDGKSARFSLLDISKISIE